MSVSVCNILTHNVGHFISYQYKLHANEGAFLLVAVVFAAQQMTVYLVHSEESLMSDVFKSLNDPILEQDLEDYQT